MPAVTPNNNNSLPAPASYSPLSIAGHSLDNGILTCNEGQWSNVSEIIRTQFQAKTLNNFQMLNRGVWSCPTGIGWTAQRNTVFNSGAAFMDFGVFETFSGTQTLLFQVGNTVYSYNLATSTETAYDAPLNNLNTSPLYLPCMRPFVDNTGDAAPITVYCNGNIQPQQITGIAAADVSALPFVGTGSPTSTSVNGGQFGITYDITTYSPGTIIANYPTTASGTPTNCCLGPDNNVWYTDFANSKVGKITPAGIVTEYSTPTGSAGPFGICVGPDGNIWFTEYLNGRICVLNITTFGITEYTTLSTPGPIVSAGGYLWVGFVTSSDAWKVYNTSGTLVNTYTTAGAYDGWFAMCLGPDRNIWGIGNKNAATFPALGAGLGFGVLGMMTLGGTAVDYSANLATGTCSYGIASGADGNIYFTDYATNQIGKIATSSGAVTYYPTPTLSSGPFGICLGSDMNMWFTENVADQLGTFEISKTTITEFTGLPAGALPQGCVIGSDHNLWYCESNSAAPAIGTSLIDDANPKGICSGPDGRIWFCEYATNKIGAIDPQTGALQEYPLPDAVSGPLGICSDGTNLWFTEYTGNRIGKITTSGTITEYTSGLSAMALLVGICYGPDGNIWFCESGTSKFGKITSGGSITEYSTTTGSSVPWGICTDGTSMYICESGVSKINKSTTGGSQTEYATTTSGSVPLWIAFGSDGRLWFTENNGNKIGAMTTGGTMTEYIIPTASAQAVGITAASDGNLYFTEYDQNQLGRITTAGLITEFAIDIEDANAYGICDGPDQSIWFSANGAGEIGNFLYGGSGTWPGVFQLTKKTYSIPKYCCYFNNRMAYFGFDPSGKSAYDCLISNQANSYGTSPTTPAGSFVTSVPIQATDAVSFSIPGLGLPTGMAAFRLTNTNNQEVLILGFQRGIAVVMGNGTSSDATTYSADILTYEYGLMSNRSFAQVQNDMYFLSTNGVRNFSNLTINANLLNAALTYQMQDVIQDIDVTAISTSNVLYNSSAFVVHHRDTLELQWWYPADGDSQQNGHAIIMNYNTMSPVPQQLTPVLSTKNGTTVACGIEFQGTMYGGGYDGNLQVHYDGNTYNGTAIQGTIDLSLIGADNIQQKLELRQGLVITEGEAQAFSVSTYFYTSNTDGSMTKNLSPEGAQALVSAGASVFIKQVYFEATGDGFYIEPVLTVNVGASSQSLDFAGLAYTATIGGIRP